MKRLVMGFAIFWMSIGTNWAQLNVAPKVPKKVIQTFQDQYDTDLEEVSWSAEEDEFIAQFWDQNTEAVVTVHYAADGKKIKTITELNENDLSNSILAYIERNLAKTVILASYKIEQEGGNQFLVDLESDKEYISILFSEDSKVLEENKQAKEEEEEEVEFEEEEDSDD